MTGSLARWRSMSSTSAAIVWSNTYECSGERIAEYELTDIFGMIREDGKVVKGYVLSGYWKDVGTPEDLEIMNKMFDD